jgi:hypothetical protein
MEAGKGSLYNTTHTTHFNRKVNVHKENTSRKINHDTVHDSNIDWTAH